MQNYEKNGNIMIKHIYVLRSTKGHEYWHTSFNNNQKAEFQKKDQGSSACVKFVSTCVNILIGHTLICSKFNQLSQFCIHSG